MNRTTILFLFLISFMRSYAQSPQLILPVGHTDKLIGTVVTPDKRSLITASLDGTAKIWNLQTGKLMFDLVLHKRELTSINLSEDGSFVVLTSKDGTYSKWKVNTGELLFQSEPWSSMLAGILLPGDSLLAVQFERGVYIFRIGQAKEEEILGESFNHTFSALTINRRKSLLAFYEQESGITVVNLLTGNKTYIEDRLYLDSTRYYDFESLKLINLQFAGDTTLLVKLGYGYLGVFNAFNGEQKFMMQGMVYTHNSDDGKYLAGIKGRNDSLVLVNLGSGSLIRTTSFERYRYQVMGFMPGNDHLFVRDTKEGMVEEWNTNGEIVSKKPASEGSAAFNAILMSMMPLNTVMIDYGYDDNDPGAARSFDNDGHVRNEFRGKVSGLESAVISTSGKYVYEIKKKYANYWDLPHGKSVRMPLLNGEQVIRKIIPVKGSNKVIVQAYSYFGLFDPENNKLVYTIEGDDAIAILPDSNLLITSSSRHLQLRELQTGKLISEKETDVRLDPLTISSDKRFIAGIYNAVKGDSVIVYDLVMNREIVRQDRPRQEVNYNFGVAITRANYTPIIEFSPGGKELFYSTGDRGWVQGFRLLDYAIIGDDTLFNGTEPLYVGSGDGLYNRYQKGVFHGGKKLGFFRLDYESGADPVMAYDYTHDSRSYLLSYEKPQRILALDEVKDLLYTDVNGEILVWDLNAKKIIKKIPVPKGMEIESLITATGQVLLSSNDRMGVLTIDQQKPVYYLSTFDSGDFIALRQDGFYLVTPKAAQSLSWKINNRLYDFDQWDLQYNRPDKLIGIMDSPDNPLTSAWETAYKKRLKRAGVLESNFKSDYHLPVVSIMKEDVDGTTVHEPNLSIDVRAVDSERGNRITRLQVMVNDNPLFGRDGYSIAGNNHDSIFHFSIPLSAGANDIRVSAFNQRGAESLRPQIRLNYAPSDSIQTTTYFVGIGINRFKDQRYNLQWSEKDIHDLAAAFRSKVSGSFVIDTLFNEQVTKQNVRALKENIRKAGINDRVIIAYSGHGLLSSRLDYYLSTYNINFDHPEQEGLPYEEIENLVDSISCRHKLILLDACHSGEVDKDEMVMIERVQQELDSTKKGFRPVEMKQPKVGMKNSFELMQELFTNVGNNTGATVISAAAGTQFALENGDLRNGVFTYSILELMKAKTGVTISMLKEYVCKRVAELTKGEQVPTARNETRSVDWKLWE